jgi:hypothetical protein
VTHRYLKRARIDRPSIEYVRAERDTLLANAMYGALIAVLLIGCAVGAWVLYVALWAVR